MTANNEHANGVGPEGLAPYRVLNTRQRARAAIVYVVMAVLSGILAIMIDLPILWLTAVFPLAAIAVFHLIASWKMPITDMDAIKVASSEASFEVGHGSATLGYRGILARPVWQVLVFSNTPSPDREALVTVDAMNGDVTGVFEQDVETP